jgi:3-hydroxyisobutyrate dehydrogenase
LRPDAVVVMCSTTTPAAFDAVRGNTASPQNVVDAPIVGGVKYARSGP